MGPVDPCTVFSSLANKPAGVCQHGLGHLEDSAGFQAGGGGVASLALQTAQNAYIALSCNYRVVYVISYSAGLYLE